MPTAAAKAPSIATLASGFFCELSNKTLNATTKTAQGREEAINATTAPGAPRICQPTAVQNASRLVPGLIRESA
jgi:hypothetical protein